MNCVEINDKTIKSWLFSSSREQDKADHVIEYFSRKGNSFEEFIAKLQELNTPVKLLNMYESGYAFFKTLAKAPPVENTSQESSGGMTNTDLILDKKQIFVDDIYTFASKHEGLNKLFKDKDHIYQKYSWFMSKFLIKSLFWNLSSKQISTNRELKIHLVNLINLYASKLEPNKFVENESKNLDKTKKVFLKVNDDGANVTITYNKSDWYYINNVLNNILKDADFNILKDLQFGGKQPLDKGRLVAAISYANFNTVLNEYLPGVITVNSSLHGFDLLNINNDQIYVLNGSTLGKGWESEDKVFDSNSNLAKLLLNSFETMTAYSDKNDKLAVDFKNQPNFSVGLYYYVNLLLSRYINRLNYSNELNQLLTALMLSKVDFKDGDYLTYLQQTNPKSIGRFTKNFIEHNKDLLEIFKDTTLYSVIATLYYNVALTDNDPIFTSENFKNVISDEVIKKVSLVKIYNKHLDISRSNIHDLIYATLLNTTERLHHDLDYDYDHNVFVSRPLTLTVVNRLTFEVQKMHHNLISFSKERRDSLFPEVARTENSLSILVNDKPFTIYILDGKRWEMVWDRDALKAVYEIFYQLTNFDLTSDVMLKRHPAFSTHNVLSVIYGLISINDELEAKEKYKREKKALNQEIWSKYCPVDNVNSILYNMGALYGKLTGIMSKMTILNKERKQLPTFGMKNIASSYKSYLIESANQPIMQGNIFAKNPNLYVESSIKNQIITSGEKPINFRELNEKDAIIFDIYYEWLQKHFFNTKLIEGKNSIGDGTFSIQPLVPADKVNQSTIKINAGAPIDYAISTITPDGVSDLKKSILSDTLNRLPSDSSAIKALREALFFSLGAQHRTRRNKIMTAFNNVLIANNLPIAYSLNTLFKAVQNVAINNNRTLEDELYINNPGENITKELYFNTFRDKNGVKQYTLNNTLLFFFDLFDVNSSIPHTPNADRFNKYHNLGLFEFLYKLGQLNIDATTTKIFPSKDYKLENIKKPIKEINEIERILKDLNLVLDRNESIDKLFGVIQTAVKNNDSELLFSDELQSQIETFLLNSSQIYQQYYWENILFGQNYEMSVNGPIYLHPLKDLPSQPTFYSESLARLAVSQKRNVDYPATVIPYTYGINGPSRVRKVYVYQDLKRQVSNPMGDSASVDTHDGGELILLLHRILENNSMLGYGNPIFHKPLIHGRLLNSEGWFEDSMLFKYASYLLTGHKLRLSRKLRNMAQYALSEELLFKELKNVLWDFATDCTSGINKSIDYSKYNIVVKTDAGNRFKSLKAFMKNEEDSYTAIWMDQDNNQSTETVTINNLYDLYKLLGAERTVTINKLKEIVEYNENAWSALLDICCRVGFRLTNELLNSKVGVTYTKMSGMSMENLRLNINNSIPNQLNIVQPLKFSYITQFTPESCIKYGSVIGNSTNDFTIRVSDPNETDEVLTTRVLNEWKTNHRLLKVYDMLGGVQQDAEHEGEETTEPTQMINGALLDNMTPEHLDLYKHIANYVIGKMTKAYPGETLFLASPEKMFDDNYFMTHMRQLAFIYNELEIQILNSSYDNGNTAAVVLASALNFLKEFQKLDRDFKDDDPNKIRKSRELAEKFTVSLSHPSIYNMVITALAAANTKLGIRRKGAGQPGVQLPHQSFLTFIKIPLLESVNNTLELEDGDFMLSSSGKLFNYNNYTTMTPDQFFDYMTEHPEFLELTRKENRYTTVWNSETGVQNWNLNIYNHYVLTKTDDTIEKIYTKDINQLKTLKSRIYNNEFIDIKLDKLSGFDWSNNIGRDLKHIDFEITVKANDKIITYNIYDTVGNELLTKLRNLNLNDDANKEKLIKEFQDFVSIYPELSMFHNITIDNEKEFANILRALINTEYKLISEGKKLITSEDKMFMEFVGNTFSPEDLSNVVSVKSIDAEMLMSLPGGSKFNINNTKHLCDISIDSISEQLNKMYYEADQLLLTDKGNRKYKVPYFFQTDSGNIYLADENIHSAGLESIEPYIYIEDGKKYVTINNKQILEITSDLEGKLRILHNKNNEPVVVLLTNKEELNMVYKSEKEIDHMKTNTNSTFWLALLTNINEVNLSESIFIKNDSTRLDAVLVWLDSEDIEHFTAGDRKQLLAKEKYAAFQAALRFASTRIPGQSYQSFASTRIGNFLHGELNAIYVNDYTIWLTGGDYDIDKLFNIGFTLSKGGKFIGWHKFFKASSYEHLKESLNLPGLNNKVEYREDGLDLNEVLFTEMNKTFTGTELIKQVLVIRGNDTFVHAQVSFQKFKAFVQLYNRLVEQGYRNEEWTSFIEGHLNNKSVINYKAPDEGYALQNRMITQMRKNLSDIRNVVPTYSPISVGEAPKVINGIEVPGTGPKGLKFTSLKYIESQSGHPDSPLKRIQDINNQSSGKSVVGIMAAGLKLYATISYVIEDMLYKNLSVKELELMIFNHNLKITDFDTDETVVITISNGFAGISYEINKELYTELLLHHGMNQQQIVEEFVKHYKRDSVLLNISLLLSAATDNGKEMILGIINSGKDTLGVYTYALMTGMSLEQIGKLMTSKEVDFIINNTKRSVLLNDPFKTMFDVGGYFLNPIAVDSFVPMSSKRSIIALLDLRVASEDLSNISIQDLEIAIKRKELILKNLIVSNNNEEEDLGYADEDYGFAPLTINAYASLQNYIKTRKEVLKLSEDSDAINKVKLFLTLLHNAQLFASTTKVLGANQRVKPNDVELIKFYINIEDSIRNYMFNKFFKKGGDVNIKGSPRYKADRDITIAEVNNNNVFGGQESSLRIEEFLRTFNLWEFMQKSELEAKKDILLFDTVKSDLNPLLVFYYAEHFREMIKTVLMTDAVLKKQSIIYRTVADFQENKLLKVMKPKEKSAVKFIPMMVNGQKTFDVTIEKKNVFERNLNPEAFSTLKNIIEDKFILETLFLLQGRLTREGKVIHITNNEGKVKLVNLLLLSEKDNILGRKEFVEFMEETLIPRLKLGKINNSSDNAINPDIRNNAFIKSLHLKDFNIRNKRGESFLAYGVMNFKSSDSLLVKLNQNELMISLYELNKLDDPAYKPTKDSDGTSVIDLLFLYNIILHRGRDGEFTLSSFFDPTKLPSSIVSKFYMLENQVNNNFELLLSITKTDLSENGFNSDLIPKLDINTPATFSSNYRYINVGEANTQEILRNLEEKVKTLFETGFIGNKIKFDCI